MFVRRDAQKPPLQPTDDGPCKVIDRKERFFVVALNGNRQDTISIDRLKPAYPIPMPETLNHSHSHAHLSEHAPSQDNATQLSPPVVRTRSGRKVQWPDCHIQTM